MICKGGKENGYETRYADLFPGLSGSAWFELYTVNNYPRYRRLPEWNTLRDIEQGFNGGL